MSLSRSEWYSVLLSVSALTSISCRGEFDRRCLGSCHCAGRRCQRCKRHIRRATMIKIGSKLVYDTAIECGYYSTILTQRLKVCASLMWYRCVKHERQKSSDDKPAKASMLKITGDQTLRDPIGNSTFLKLACMCLLHDGGAHALLYCPLRLSDQRCFQWWPGCRSKHRCCDRSCGRWRRSSRCEHGLSRRSQKYADQDGLGQCRGDPR